MCHLRPVRDNPPEDPVLYDGEAPEDASPVTRDECPDGGACHHWCVAGCFRVLYCGPLSGVYPGNEWPAELRAAEIGMT